MGLDEQNLIYQKLHQLFVVIITCDHRALDYCLSLNQNHINLRLLGLTPLHIAILFENHQARNKLLQSKGVNLFQRDSNGLLPMDYFIEHKKKQKPLEECKTQIRHLLGLSLGHVDIVPVTDSSASHDA